MTPKIIVFITTSVLLGLSCSQKQQKSKIDFSHDPLGYYYKLIDFQPEVSWYKHKHVAWVSACFKTQSDSIFWDSFNNLSDKFFIEMDSSKKDNFLRNHVSKCAALDSGCLLIKTSDFFSQQFKTRGIPFFSTNDSVVKVNFKIKHLFTPGEFVKISRNLLKDEEEQIEHFFGTFKAAELALDPLGFYWITKPANSEKPLIKEGDKVVISYQGQFLNGRFLEKSTTHFEFIYGTPDQLLRGLNNVIGRLKLGENAKIILPSRLAFGENGSSNGTVPPYTPLIYELKIIDVKVNDEVKVKTPYHPKTKTKTNGSKAQLASSNKTKTKKIKLVKARANIKTKKRK